MGELPTFDVLLEYVVDDGVYILVHVLEEEREAILDGQLQLLQEVVVVKGTHLSYEMIGFRICVKVVWFLVARKPGSRSNLR